jgi:hypothetical protein
MAEVDLPKETGVNHEVRLWSQTGEITEKRKVS